MAKRSGSYFELADGRLGIAYNDEQGDWFKKHKLFIRLVDENLNEMISQSTNKPAIVVKKMSEVNRIGFAD